MLSRIYCYSRGMLVFLGLLYGGVIIASTVGLYFIFRTGSHPDANNMGLAGVCIAFIAIALIGLISAYAYKIIFTSEEIEYKTLFSRRSMRRDAIKGYRQIAGGQVGTNALILIPKDSEKPLKISDYFAWDDDFRTWLDSLPNLDGVEKQESLRALEENINLGTTKEERVERLTEANRYTQWLKWGSYFLAAWGYIFPSLLPGSYDTLIVLLAIMPLVALYVGWKYRGFVAVDKTKTEPRSSIAIPILFPSIVLVFRMLIDNTFFSWSTLLLEGILLGVLFAYLVFSLDRTSMQKVSAVISMSLFLIAYGIGLVAAADVLHDTSSLNVYEARLIAKQIIHSRSTTYEFTLAPWGGGSGGTEDVSSRLYNAVQEGSKSASMPVQVDCISRTTT